MKLKFVGEQKEDKLPPERGYSSNQTNRKPKFSYCLMLFNKRYDMFTQVLRYFILVLSN